MKNLPLILLFLATFSGADAQVFNRLFAPVTWNGTDLLSPWAGGLNAPQWSSVDLNDDGKLDLYAFDRNGDVHLTFLNIGAPGETKYVFAPDLATNFPKCVNFTLLRDFNRDGAMDIFAHAGDEGIPGIKVFRGKFENNKLIFNRVNFPDWGVPNHVIVVPTSGGDFSQLPVNSPDYPAIDDMDGDGDLDILTLNLISSYIAYYQNMALEMGYTDDTLIYKEDDDCWGKIYIAPFAQSFVLSPSPDACAFCLTGGDEEERTIHGGATLLTFDDDMDEDKEICYGDLIYPHIIFGKNGGSTQNAWVTEQDTTYPKFDMPVNIPDFPASFFLDMDNDGVKDFVASPNIPNGSLDQEVVWFYKNYNTDNNPAFEFQEKKLMVEDMLDLGTGALPAWVDYNADGLMDFVVGNFDIWQPNFDNNPFLYLFLNIGTMAEPAWKLEDANWLNFNQFASGSFAFAPTFGDLDSDGDLDLLVGERYGRLFFVENIAGPGQPMSFGPIQPFWKGITVGQFSTPAIHDLNKDGLQDLIIGEYVGTINYMPNIGTPTDPEFFTNPDDTIHNNRFLGKINTQQPNYASGYSAPVILEFDTITYLATGTEMGFLQLYKVEEDKLEWQDSFDVVTKNFSNLCHGKITRPTFANINGDNYLDVLVGNYRGGLELFSTTLNLDGIIPTKETLQALQFELFPNPTGENLQVNLPEFKPGSVFQIFNALGQNVMSGKLDGMFNSLNVGELEDGIYFMQIKVDNSVGTQRFLKN